MKKAIPLQGIEFSGWITIYCSIARIAA